MPTLHPSDPALLAQLATRLAEHHARVRRILLALCATLGVDPTLDLIVAASLHDIGRLAMLELSNRPRPLTEEEWRIMRHHPIIASSILEAAGFLRAARIAALHHERWDGTGYPNGLAGAAIPIEARILAAADTLAALTEPRPYRNGDLNPASELRRAAGTQLDPEIALAAASLAGKLR